MIIKAEDVQDGTTEVMEDATDGTTEVTVDTGSDGSPEDAQSSDEEADYWAEAVEAMTGDEAPKDTEEAAPEAEAEVLPAEEEVPVEAADSEVVQDVDYWKKQSENFDKMQRDTKRSHSEIAQSNADLCKELDVLKLKIDPTEEVSDADPATRGDVKDDFDKLYEERKGKEQEAAKQATAEAQRADGDKAFYDNVRKDIPEFDKIVNDPEFKDWHAQHKNWADAQINDVDVDDPSGMVSVLNRYKTTLGRQKEASKKKSSRLIQTIAPAGKGSPKTTQGDDYEDAVRSVRAGNVKTSFTNFV